MAVRLGGPSCLAGDVIGDYRLPGGAHIGQRFAFLDQAHYSMVKTNTFNGVPLPSIWLWDSATDALSEVRSFGYEDFKTTSGNAQLSWLWAPPRPIVTKKSHLIPNTGFTGGAPPHICAPRCPRGTSNNRKAALSLTTVFGGPLSCTNTIARWV